MIETAIAAFTAFFITVEPVALVPLFLALVADRDVRAKRAAAIAATVEGCINSMAAMQGSRG